LGAHAEGSWTIAEGTYSHAEGIETTAAGFYSHAEGMFTAASGYGSHAEGSYATASGYGSHAEGQETAAEGDHSHAEGYATTASGNFSHAEGYETVASGYGSHAAALYTIAQNNYQTVIGKYNIPTSSTLNNTQNDDAFIIGNGTSLTARSNAFRVQYTGQVYAAGTYNTGGADYAEMFEWRDGNPQNQDRRGFFVTLDGECIRKATDQDPYVLGVVSNLPAMVGDAGACGWHDMYQRDKWGTVLNEWVETPLEKGVLNQETGQIETQTEMIRQYVPKVNPAYDPTREYQPRAERPEWSAIGMMGKLIVRDDGTCRPNGYCRPNAKGMATASEGGYPVLKRIDTDMVLIVFR